MAKKKKSEAGHRPSGLPAHDVPSTMPELLAQQVALHKYKAKDLLPGPMVWHVLQTHKRMRESTKLALMFTLVKGFPAGYAADQCGLTAGSMIKILSETRQEVKAAIASGVVPVTNTDAIMAKMLAHPERYAHIMRIVTE